MDPLTLLFVGMKINTTRKIYFYQLYHPVTCYGICIFVLLQEW